MNESYRSALDRLSRVPGVRGALVALADDGVPVVEELQPDVSGAAIAALSAALFRRTALAAESADLGPLEALQLEAEGGQVLIGGAGELIVVALISNDAQIGRARVEVLRAAQSLSDRTEPPPS
ncbi:MAG: roadblock/LC7 domain-containing protein [Longimicrobiales bacterium]